MYRNLILYLFILLPYWCGQINKDKPTHKPEYLIALDSIYYNPVFKRELRYADTNNFLGEKLYSHNPGLWLEKNAARALRLANYELLKYGVQILIWDAYRPYSITVKMYEMSPKKQHVANPERGSLHNRGGAVDITLINLNGKILEMPTNFDEFGIKATPIYTGGTIVSRQNRDLLIRTMQKYGFRVNGAEWWHFDYKDAYKYFVSDWEP